MFRPGEIISHMQMSLEEGIHLQKGMHFRLHPTHSVLLMSVRKDAPYADAVQEDGRVLIYEGHDERRIAGGPDPKTLDQPMRHSGGSLTENGMFYSAAKNISPERVRVYEKLHRGIWVYNGVFELRDACLQPSGPRKVFKFRLVLSQRQDVASTGAKPITADLEHTRMIPSHVKLAVWKRDGGKCVRCGASDNLHFDHILPFSKGGTSLTATNIQLLCARHNLAKRDRIE